MQNKQATSDDRYFLHYADSGQFEYASNFAGKTIYVPNHDRYDPDTNPDAAEFLAYGYDLSDLQMPQSESLQKAIEFRLAEIEQKAKQIQDTAVAQYSAGEISTWDRKEADARAILVGESAPLLEREAAIGKNSVQALADVVVRKADEYRIFSATVVGIRSRHQQAISALTSVEEVMSYVVDGWPSL